MQALTNLASAGAETIAPVESTGRYTGPYVHFEIRLGNQAAHPLRAMAKDFMLAADKRREDLKERKIEIVGGPIK